MPQPNPDNAITDKRRLNSWKEIAAYLGKDVRTVQRWEAREGLPIHRKPHDKLSSVYAYEAEIDSWWDQGSHPNPVGRPLRRLTNDPPSSCCRCAISVAILSRNTSAMG